MNLTVLEASDAEIGALAIIFELSLNPRNSSVARLPPGGVSPVSVSARPFPRTDWRTLRLNRVQHGEYESPGTKDALLTSP